MIDYDLQNQKLPKIKEELDKNYHNSLYKSQLRDTNHTQNVRIYIENIKLWTHFPIQLVIKEHPSASELADMKEYLELANHKIHFLNLSNVDKKHITKVITILDSPNINYKYLDIIYFGYKKLKQKQFILFGKWILNKFSPIKDNDDFNLVKYLFNWRCKRKQNLDIEEGKQNVNFEFINSSVHRRSIRHSFYRSVGDHCSQLRATNNEDKWVEVILCFDRILYPDDLKMLYLITQRCNEFLKMNVKARGMQKESELFEYVDVNTRNPLAKLSLMRKDIWSYKYFQDIETRINFDFLVKFAYISFVINLMICIILPVFAKHETWGRGQLWGGHLAFGCYLVFSFISEFLVLKWWFTKETWQTFFEGNKKWSVYSVMGCYALIGILSKGDIYTDIAFLVEMQKCNRNGEDVTDFFVFLVATLIFLWSIIYNLVCLLKLLIKSPKSTFWPKTSHLTRILMCSDFRLLAMAMDKFSVTYYERFLWWSVPTFKILALFKVLFEDTAQAALQLVYVFFFKNKQINLLIVIVSFCFSAPSILSSILCILRGTSSSLNKEDYDLMVNRKNI